MNGWVRTGLLHTPPPPNPLDWGGWGGTVAAMKRGNESDIANSEVAESGDAVKSSFFNLYSSAQKTGLERLLKVPRATSLAAEKPCRRN